MFDFNSLQKSVGYVGHVGKTAQPQGLQVSDKGKIRSDRVGYPQGVSAKLSDLSDRGNVESDTPKPSNGKDCPTYPTYPTQKQGEPKNVAANDPSGVTSWKWLIHFADRESIEVSFSPEVNHAEVLGLYPETVAVELVSQVTNLTAQGLSADKEAAIRSWLVSIGEDDQAIVNETLEMCRRDDGARAYFLGQAEQFRRETH
jgi:hypothetical protein